MAAAAFLAVNGIGVVCIAANYMGIKPEWAQSVSRITLGVFMLAAGGAHFEKKLMPLYMSIMPPMLPYKRELIYLSGIMEGLGGVLSLIPSTEDIGGYLIIATLIAVFPANIYMAMSPEAQRVMGATQIQAYLRLPLQVVMIGMAWIYLRRKQTPIKDKED